MDKFNRKKFNKAWRKLIFKPNNENLENMKIVLQELYNDGMIDKDCYNRNSEKLQKLYGRFEKRKLKHKKL